MLEEACELVTAAYGPESLKTLKALNNLSIVYGRWKRYEDAMQIQESVLKKSESILGSHWFVEPK